MREIATIVEQHQETLDQAVAAIRAGFDKAKDHDRKAHHARIDVGLKLIALRKRIEAGEAGYAISWWKWYGRHFARTRKDAEKVMAMAGAENPEAAAEAERAKAREGMKAHREREKETQSQVTANVSGDQGDPEVSAEMMKAKFAGADDEEDDEPDNQTKQPSRAEVAKLVRAWAEASPEAKREFVRERWDEIARARKQLDTNGGAHEDRWIEGDTV